MINNDILPLIILLTIIQSSNILKRESICGHDLIFGKPDEFLNNNDIKLLYKFR